MIHHISCSNIRSWCSEINDLLSKYLPKSGRLFLPAGNTPIPLYEHWEETKPGFLKDSTLIQIDEVCGTKMFESFFRSHLPSYIQQFEWIDIANKTADVALLGIGENGHVGFHEPGIPPDFKGGEVELALQTTLALNLDLDKAKGLTYGLGSFMECDAVILAVRDRKKKPIVDRILQGDETLPASTFFHHKNAHIVTFYPDQT